MREPAPPPCDRLFAYGTLVIPEVFRAVTGRAVPGRWARLDGFARYRVKLQPFPGIIEAPAGTTEGVLYPGLGAGDWQQLDAFESDFYDRRVVSVILEDGSCLDAYTYVTANRFHAALSTAPWDCEYFCRHHLARYVRDIGTP